jgi:hypothetical protein
MCCGVDTCSVYELNNQSKHYVSNWGEQARVHLIFDYVDNDSLLPQSLEVLTRGECLAQTRRSIDRKRHAGQRPVGPSFIIIGAQKSGTTAVYEYLHQHPLVSAHFFLWLPFAVLKNAPCHARKGSPRGEEGGSRLRLAMGL